MLRVLTQDFRNHTSSQNKAQKLLLTITKGCPSAAAEHNMYDQCQLFSQSPVNHILSAEHDLRKTDKQLGQGLFVINTIHCHANAT